MFNHYVCLFLVSLKTSIFWVGVINTSVMFVANSMFNILLKGIRLVIAISDK